MSLIRKHGAVLQAWACLDLVAIFGCSRASWRKRRCSPCDPSVV